MKIDRYRPLLDRKFEDVIDELRGLGHEEALERLKAGGVREIMKLEGQVVKQRASARAEKKKVKIVNEENEALQARLDTIIGVLDAERQLVQFNDKKPVKNEVCAMLGYSDWHFEETVDPDTVNGINEFNLDIARERSTKLFENSVKLIQKEQKSNAVNKLLIWLGGDFISGYIHPELEESNQCSPTESIIILRDVFRSGIEFILDETNIEDVIIQTNQGNHCIRVDTEVLTQDGFIEAKDLDEDSVLATYDMERELIHYRQIEALDYFTQKGYYNFKGINSEENVTEGHNLIVNNKFKKAFSTEKQKETEFTHAANCEQERLCSFTDDELKLITWVVCDGTMLTHAKEGQPNKKRIQFKLSKQRKIKRLTSLLVKMGIRHTFRPATMSPSNKLQPYYIRIYGDDARYIYDELLEGKKEFPEVLTTLNRERALTVVEEIKHTDGTDRNNNLVEWSCVVKKDINTIQTMCVLNNIQARSTTRTKIGSFTSKRKELHTLFIRKNGCASNRYVRRTFVDETAEFAAIGAAYKTIITRVNGKVVITGNSRTTDKKRISTDYKNSFEYILYQILQSDLKDKATMNVTKGQYGYTDIYGHKVRTMHGDMVRYQGGIGGISIPLIKHMHRLNQQIHADINFLGHFHQLISPTRDMHVNGSLIGPSAYSVAKGFPPEKPAQMFKIIDPEHGVTGSYPIFCE